MTRPSVPLAPATKPDDPAGAKIPRRSFLTRASAAVLGALLALIPLVPGLAFFLDPLFRRRDKDEAAGGGAGFVRVTTTDLVGPMPQKFPVVMDRWDAWNYFPDQQVGNVILRKTTDGPIASADDVLAFSDICPHLGCTVDYKPGAAAERAFLCPCHASAFSLAGEKANDIPPRNLDRLKVELRNGNEVWIKYEKFEAGRHEQTVIT